MRKFREMIFSGGNKGFTLIELLVVIAVLGILAGIAIPRITGVRDEAEKGALKASASSFRNALEMYYALEGSYPDVSIGKLSEVELAASGDFDLDFGSDVEVWITNVGTIASGVTSYSGLTLGLTGDGYSVVLSSDGGVNPNW